MTIRPIGAIIPPIVPHSSTSSPPATAMPAIGGLSEVAGAQPMPDASNERDGAEQRQEREWAAQAYHRQLRIRADTLAAFIDYVDARTKTVVLTVPLEMAGDRNGDGDIVIGGLDTLI